MKTKVDILFSASGRPEFTAESLASIRDNTNWDLVGWLWIYLDNPSPEVRGVVARWLPTVRKVAVIPQLFDGHFGGPVAIMLDYLEHPDAGELFAKLDNDVIVPSGWLEAAAGVMDRHPELDLLGLEPPLSRTPAPWATGKQPRAPELDSAPGYARCDSIGGVGLMRRRAFEGRPRMVPHSVYGGFTNWQTDNPYVTKGWIVPPISLFLLDRLPFEPWASFSRDYIARGLQRPWTNYGLEASSLWEWWLDATPAGDRGSSVTHVG